MVSEQLEIVSVQKQCLDNLTHRLSTRTSKLRPTTWLSIRHLSLTVPSFCLAFGCRDHYHGTAARREGWSVSGSEFPEQFLVFIITRRVESLYRPIEENDSCLAISFAAVNPKKV